MTQKTDNNILFAVIILMIFSAFIILAPTTVKSDNPPHLFDGYATDNGLNDIKDGTQIRAMIIHNDGSNDSYTTTVDNSLPDKNYELNVYGITPQDNNAPIYFFIGSENTTQWVPFFTDGGGINENFSSYFNITIIDKPEIIDNSPSSGTTGDSYTFNVTVTDLVDDAANLTVNADYTHGNVADNLTLINSVGDYFEGTIDNLDHNISDMTYTIWANDTTVESNSSPGTVTVTDNDKPNSTVSEISGYWKNSTHNPLNITGTAEDNIGLKNVSLYYYYSTNNVTWSSATLFDINDTDPWIAISWDFTFPDGDGFYRFYSIANDNASNTEDAPLINNTNCSYDSVAPVASLTALSTYKKDDFNVEWSATEATSGNASWTVEYRENVSGTWTAWLTNVSYATTSSTWEIANTTENCTVYFRVLGVDNASNVGAWSSTVSTTKDTVAPNSSINNQTAGYYSYFQNNSYFTISANVNVTSETSASGINYIALYYWFNNATNNATKLTNNWNDSTLFGTTNTTPWIDISNVSWNFSFSNGTGYYRFCSKAYDNASNCESLLDLNQTNNSECFYQNTPPETPTRLAPTGTSVEQTTDLSWSCSDLNPGDTLTYDVYFGTSSSPPLVSDNQSGTTHDTGTMTYSTKYYWKIVAWDNHNASNSSSIWDFTIKDDPGGSPPGGGGPPGGSPSTNNAPSADAGGPYSDYVDISIEFDGSDSSDSDGTITNYTWDMGDGTTLYGVTVSHIYTSTGTYDVTLTVTDDDDATDSETTTATIVETGGIVLNPPIAKTNGPYTGSTYKDIEFNGSASFDSDGNIVNYTWNLGDGTILFGPTVTYNYTSSGEYTVRLTVKDDDDLTDSNTTTANISLDTDADGIIDEEDFGPEGEDYSQDHDNDGESDEEDLDDDNDGIPDKEDDHNYDHDNDGTDDVNDDDDDNDGIPDEEDEYPFDHDNDGIDDVNDDDDDNDGIPDDEDEYPNDYDNDALPDNEDTDDDNDGVPDNIEELFGSDSKNNADGTSIEIEGTTHYLIYTDGDGKYDIFYNSETGQPYKVQKKKDGKIKIDTDGDGKWDYIYDPLLGTLDKYTEKEEPGEFPTLLVGIIAVIVIIILIIVGLFKIGYLYIEVEEEGPSSPPVKEKPVKKKESPRRRQPPKKTSKKSTKPKKKKK